MSDQVTTTTGGAIAAPRKYPQWFHDTVAEGVALCLENGGGMAFSPKGEAVDGTIKLFKIGLWSKGLPEGETWDQVLDQWRIAKTFTVHITNATRFPFLKNLLYQLPERETDPAIIEQRNQRFKAWVAARENRLAALPPPPKPVNHNPTPEEITARRNRALSRLRALGKMSNRPAGMDPVDFMRNESERDQEGVA